MKPRRDVPYLVCFLMLAAPLLLAADVKPLPAPVLPKPWYEANVKGKKVPRIALSPDGKRIAVLSSEEGLVFYDRKTGKEVNGIRDKLTHTSMILLYTPDGKRVLTSGAGRLGPDGKRDRHELLVWDVTTGKCLQWILARSSQGFNTGRGPGSSLYGVSDKVLVVGGEKEVATVYDLKTGNEIGTFPGQHRPRCLALSRDGKWLLTLGKDDALCVWDVENRTLLRTLTRRARAAVAISADGAFCASGTDDKGFCIFDRKMGKQLAWSEPDPSLRLGGLLFTPKGKTLVATGSGGQEGLTVWDWATGREMRDRGPKVGVKDGRPVALWDSNDISDARIAADETLLTFDYNAVRLWDLNPPEPPLLLPTSWNEAAVKPKQVHRVTIAPDGKRIAVLSKQGIMYFYNPKTGNELGSIHNKALQDSLMLLFTRDGKRLLTSTTARNDRFGNPDRNEVLIWDITTGKCFQRIMALSRQGFSAIPGPGAGLYGVSDKLLVVGGENDVASVYDLKTGDIIGTFPGQHRPRCLALSRDGKWLLTAGTDNALCVWDVEKKTLHRTLTQHNAAVSAVAISDDGSWCASVSGGHRLYVFDRAKGKRVASADTEGSQSSSGLLFNPNGNTLVAVGGGRHRLQVWDWGATGNVRGCAPDSRQKDGRFKFLEKLADIKDASFASDGTLLTFDQDAVRLWDLKPSKPATSAKSPSSK